MEAIIPAALPGYYCSSGFDNDLQLIFIFGSGVSYPPQILCGVQVSLLINQEAITWAAIDLRVVFWLCGLVLSPAGKRNQHLHNACQQVEA